MSKPNLPGLFITFEGGEGVGKSTHLSILAKRLQAAGIEVLCLREPGGTDISEKIRAIVLDPENDEISEQTELLLYEAARAQLVSQRIKPALTSGLVVLCDRYLDSTVAYQGYGRKLGPVLVNQANQLGSLGLMPARTILLIDDMQTALTRARALGTDRLEAENLDFHQRVTEGFQEVAKSHPDRIRIVQVQSDWESTAELVFAAVADLFSEYNTADLAITDEIRQWAISAGAPVAADTPDTPVAPSQ